MIREGEADFVLLHPDRGLLIVEVKGGAVRLEGRGWWRGDTQIKDPFRQAARSRWALLSAARARAGWEDIERELAHGDVVITPHHRWEGRLPLNADPRGIIDADGLTELEERLLQALDAWGPSRPVPPLRWEALLGALLPSLRLVRCDARAIADEASRIVQLTEVQHAALLGLLAAPTALVEGGAGSGKTLLALEFAERLSRSGARVLVLCFNRHLADWMTERLAGEGAGPPIQAASFHAFALRLAREAGIEFDVPRGSEAAPFWREEAPLILEQALVVLRGAEVAPAFDGIIVDEGQDFEASWWRAVHDLRGAAGRLYVFQDRHQRLRPAVPGDELGLPVTLRLETNCRNTRQIATSGGSLVSEVPTTLQLAPLGEPPLVIRANTREAAPALARAEVERLLRAGVSPAQIALVGPASLTGGRLQSLGPIGGVPLTDQPREWRGGRGLLVTTARSFKGLEADVVVLYGVEDFGSGFSRADLYVAWTRPRHRLFIVAAEGEVRAAAEAAIKEGCPVVHADHR